MYPKEVKVFYIDAYPPVCEGRVTFLHQHCFDYVWICDSQHRLSTVIQPPHFPIFFMTLYVTFPEALLVSKNRPQERQRFWPRNSQLFKNSMWMSSISMKQKRKLVHGIAFCRGSPVMDTGTIEFKQRRQHVANSNDYFWSSLLLNSLWGPQRPQRLS